MIYKTMKHIIFIILLLVSSTAWSDNIEPADSTGGGDITTQVASAIESGNASALAAFFSATIDLTLPGSEGTYSRSQAELIVKNFFIMNKPENFTIQHKGSSGEGNLFCIGMLATDNGDFRTYFLIKVVDNISMITQLQFEED